MAPARNNRTAPRNNSAAPRAPENPSDPDPEDLDSQLGDNDSVRSLPFDDPAAELARFKEALNIA